MIFERYQVVVLPLTPITHTSPLGVSGPRCPGCVAGTGVQTAVPRGVLVMYVMSVISMMRNYTSDDFYDSEWV